MGRGGNSRPVVAAATRMPGRPAKSAILLLIGLGLVTGPAADAATLFAEDGAIPVELVGPVAGLFEDKRDDRERPMVLRVADAELEVGVRLRGKSRRRVCDYPPLRLDFGDTDTQATMFAGQERLKLVTHCRGDAASEINVLEEYLAYRIFSLLTGTGYRVRLLRLTYTDTEGQLDPDVRERFGFVIEPAGHLAQRIEAEELETRQVSLRDLDPDHAALVYVFQYLIGNTDWSLVSADGDEHCCHNGDLFRAEGKIRYVPYDFDLAGIVNAAYARPDPKLDLRSVRQRRYRGFCTDEAVLLGAIRRVQSHRDAIETLIANTPGLSAKAAQGTVGFLEGFFERAEDEEKLLKSFARQCLKP